MWFGHLAGGSDLPWSGGNWPEDPMDLFHLGLPQQACAECTTAVCWSGRWAVPPASQGLAGT